jgi:hypothetical protein
VVSAITVKEPERIQAMEIDDSEWGNNDSRPASQAQGAVHSDSNAPSWMGAAKASVQEAMGGLTGSDPNAAQGGGEGGAANGRKLSCACSCRNMRPNKGSMVLLYSIGTLATFVLLVYSLLPGQNAPSCSGDTCATKVRAAEPNELFPTTMCTPAMVIVGLEPTVETPYHLVAPGLDLK